MSKIYTVLFHSTFIIFYPNNLLVTRNRFKFFNSLMLKSILSRFHLFCIMRTAEDVCRRSTRISIQRWNFQFGDFTQERQEKSGWQEGSEKRRVRGKKRGGGGEGRKRARDVKDFWCRTRAIWPRLGRDGSAVVRSRGRKEADRFASQIEILKFKSCRDLSLKSPRPPARGDGGGSGGRM